MSNVLIVGMAYKPDISDVRESPALSIVEELYEKGVNIGYYDPHVSKVKFSFGNLTSVKKLDLYDCIVIVSNHSCIDYEELVLNGSTFVDTRNCLKNLDLDDRVFTL